jgi:hypothetical protein
MLLNAFQEHKKLPINIHIVTSSRPPTTGQAALSLSKNEEAANIKEYQFDMEAKGNVNYQAIWANPQRDMLTDHWTEQAEKERC